jgi:hypothetical protein
MHTRVPGCACKYQIVVLQSEDSGNVRNERGDGKVHVSSRVVLRCFSINLSIVSMGMHRNDHFSVSMHALHTHTSHLQHMHGHV